MGSSRVFLQGGPAATSSAACRSGDAEAEAEAEAATAAARRGGGCARNRVEGAAVEGVRRSVDLQGRWIRGETVVVLEMSRSMAGLGWPG